MIDAFIYLKNFCLKVDVYAGQPFIDYLFMGSIDFHVMISEFEG